MTTSALRGHAAPHHHRLLLCAAQRGDALAAEELLRDYEPLVRARVWRLRLPAGIERDDVAQEARVGLLRAIRRWRPERGPFPAFADRCLTNHALKAIDSANARKHRVLTHARSLDTGFVDEPPGCIRVPRWAQQSAALPALDTVVIAREQLHAVASELPLLSPRERDVLSGVIAGRSQTELAEDLGATRKAVATALARARTKLNRTLQAA